MPNQFLSDEFGDLEEYFVTDYRLIDQYIGDQLWTWGLGTSGQLGVNDTTTRNTPVTTIIGGTNWKFVANGGTHTLAIKTDGTLWSWGNNSVGQLGVNDNVDRSTPVTTILGGTNWKSIAAGRGTSAAIKTDGTLWTWGSGGNGSLGVNDTTNRSTPVTTILGGKDWRSVDISGLNAAAIKTDGTLWNWGKNTDGQLGVNDNVDRSTPVTTILGGTNWNYVSVDSDGFSGAIKTDGSLWVWGDNYAGRLGVNDFTYRSTPVTTILGGTNWKYVSSAGYSAAAIKTDGTLWTWGGNSAGQLGTNAGSGVQIRTPVTTILGGTNWKYLSFGGDLNAEYIAAIKTDGTLWTWGDNVNGKLGVNDTTDRFTPVTTILGGNNWKFVETDLNHMTAVTVGLTVDFS